MENALWKRRHLGKRANMSGILPKRVVDWKLMGAQAYGPGLLFRAAVDVALHVLRLDYKESVFRDSDVIDLRRAFRRSQENIVKHLVFGRQTKKKAQGGLGFS